MEEEKLFELLTSVKNMVKADPTQACTALTSHPNLAYALMKEMVVLDMVDPEVLTRTLQAATGVQPPQNQTPQPPPQQSYPSTNGAPSYPSYPALSSTPTYPTPVQPVPYQQPLLSTAPYSTPTYPSSSTPTYPPTATLPYPPAATPSYPPSYPPQPPQIQPQAPSIPPHAYQARPQQPQAQQQPPRLPPSAPPAGMGSVPGLAPEQQAMVQRLALLTPDQIAALPPADRAALIELRRQLGLE
ncbi:unnamed protein product [Rhizoctonia solani]|uniref:Cleavage stimulation factor subunit 2 hinge domain-containing protein n=1 Tax=Rhizoctonia solani TaxID=456999 RepID=A0A8H3CDQ3_9AGAM|nr:unnamed protein product [Rhizoctonia solani]CAE6480359.1 unnamed protein product [Rhizoctonia solani]